MQVSTPASSGNSSQAPSFDLTGNDSPRGPGAPATWIWDFFDKVPDPGQPGKYLGKSGRAHQHCKQYESCGGYKESASVEWGKKHLLSCKPSQALDPGLVRRIHQHNAQAVAAGAKASGASRFSKEAKAAQLQPSAAGFFSRGPGFIDTPCLLVVLRLVLTLPSLEKEF